MRKMVMSLILLNLDWAGEAVTAFYNGRCGKHD